MARVLPDDANLNSKVIAEVNGETKAVMEHARKLQAAGTDTSIDEPWEVDPSLALNDSYVLFTSKLYLYPKLLLLWLPTTLLLLPYAVIARAYGACLPIPTDAVPRGGVGFGVALLLARLAFAPAFIVGALSLGIDYFFYYLFGGLFFLAASCCGSDSSSKVLARYRASQLVLKPYRSGPPIYFSDVFVCSVGQALRNGAGEHALSFATMLMVMPWLKYYVNANPLIYPLKERFVQQISTSLADVGVGTVHEKAREIISRSRQEGSLAGRLDLWRFCPHYPHPPPCRRWANGMQSANVVTLLTHSTHAAAEAKGVGEAQQWLLSTSAERPVWRVMLWYSNPYHFFSGWVEASISHGRPSQEDKVHGGEHPMWLVTSPSPLLSKRDAPTGPGMIDAFFDAWLPTIVDEVRRLAKGPEYAAARHQGVVSKDGLSRPAAAVGAEHYTEEGSGAGDGSGGGGGGGGGGREPPAPALVELVASVDAVAVVDRLSLGYRSQPLLLEAAEKALGVELLRGEGADAAFEDNAWTAFHGKRLAAAAFDVQERTLTSTAMDGLVAADAPTFEFRAGGYVEDAPLGLGRILYVVVGYVSRDVRVVRAACKAEGDDTPDPKSPGELVLCTSLPPDDDPGHVFKYRYKSAAKGTFDVSLRLT